VPDGQWTVQDALDGDGLTDDPVRVAVTLRKQGDRVQVDLRGCADQTRGPVNASRAATSGRGRTTSRGCAPRAPANDGCPGAGGTAGHAQAPSSTRRGPRR
jgi:N-methylhydantoinase B